MNKHSVFVAARKRGVGLEVVRAFLRSHGAPPTLSEEPEQRRTFEGPPIRTQRLASDYREISSALSAALVLRIEKGELHDARRDQPSGCLPG